MSRLRYNRREAVAWLRAQCPAMDRFIARCGPLELRVTKDADLFRALSAAIIYQQLSGKAAATIHGRFCDLFPGGRPEPERLAGKIKEALALPEQERNWQAAQGRAWAEVFRWQRTGLQTLDILRTIAVEKTAS